VAEATGGTYFPAESASELQEILDSLPTSLIVKTEATEISVAFVGLGLVAASAAFVLGRRWRPLP
jgi:hypothetical protein